jgi:hypothetical protein
METPTSTTYSLSGDKDLKDKKTRVEWSPENEKILVEWCDIAQCYKWLNTRAHNKFSRLHAWFTIPAIIFSTISGTASFAQESFPLHIRAFAPAIIGTINITIGILTTIQQYLKISELNESHRVSSIAWDKYARNIRIELSKAPSERPDAALFIKYNRDEFDRLMETSPSIPEQIISDFMTVFANSKDPIKKKQYAILKKPDICDIIVSAEENRHHWYKELELPNITLEPTDLEERVEQDILKREEELRKKEQDMCEIQRKLELAESERLSEMKKRERDKQTATKAIDEYVKLFETAHGRRPIQDEIMEEFKSKFDDRYVTQYIASYIINQL